MDIQEVVESEVRRKLDRMVRQHNDQLAALNSQIEYQKKQISTLSAKLESFTAEPSSFATLLEVNSCVEPCLFDVGDEVIVTDQSSPYLDQVGKIVELPNESGDCVVAFEDGRATFQIGIAGKLGQLKLCAKNDGTSAKILSDGKIWEVCNVPNVKFAVGDTIRIKPDTKAILGVSKKVAIGPVCVVDDIVGDKAKVSSKGETHFLLALNDNLRVGDRIVCDASMSCALEVLPKNNAYRTSVANITWNDVGGLDEAKQQLQDAIELPYKHPELFVHFGLSLSKGVLLYGPPGCGKTLLARVCSWALANMHGRTPSDSGYVYVKSPEILSKWVGNTEAEIRSLFQTCRQHYLDHGYKAILVFDEADAIMPCRGMRRSSDVVDTIVPMFLGEMDGMDQKQTEANPIVILMTNRVDVLDPAIVRPGRISQHIKVNRPDEKSAIDILDIHTRNLPFEIDREAALHLMVADIFSKSRLLYKVNAESFTFADVINGAMLEHVVQTAKMNALHRDLKSGTQTTVSIVDLQQAVQHVFEQQRGLNHSYDLQDFCERHSLHFEKAVIEKYFK